MDLQRAAEFRDQRQSPSRRTQPATWALLSTGIRQAVPDYTMTGPGARSQQAIVDAITALLPAQVHGDDWLAMFPRQQPAPGGQPFRAGTEDFTCHRNPRSDATAAAIGSHQRSAAWCSRFMSCCAAQRSVATAAILRPRPGEQQRWRSAATAGRCRLSRGEPGVRCQPFRVRSGVARKVATTAFTGERVVCEDVRRLSRCGLMTYAAVLPAADGLGAEPTADGQ